MWESISKLIGANSTAVLIITIVGTFSVWLYKEFKVMNNENFKSKVALINKKIEMYSKLEAAIANVLHQKDRGQAKSNLYEKFGEFSSYFSNDVRRIMRDYYRQDDSSLLNTLLAFTEVEVKKLEKEKSTLSMNDTSTDVMDLMGRLVRPLSPIGMVWILVLWALFFLSQIYQTKFIWEKLSWGLISVSTLFALILIFGLISLFIDNNLSRRISVYRWLFIMGSICPPWIAVFFVRYSLIFVLIQGISFFMFIKISKKQKPGILLIE